MQRILSYPGNKPFHWLALTSFILSLLAAIGLVVSLLAPAHMRLALEDGHRLRVGPIIACMDSPEGSTCSRVSMACDMALPRSQLPHKASAKSSPSASEAVDGGAVSVDDAAALAPPAASPIALHASIREATDDRDHGQHVRSAGRQDEERLHDRERHHHGQHRRQGHNETDEHSGNATTSSGGNGSGSNSSNTTTAPPSIMPMHEQPRGRTKNETRSGPHAPGPVVPSSTPPGSRPPGSVPPESGPPGSVPSGSPAGTGGVGEGGGGAAGAGAGAGGGGVSGGVPPGTIAPPPGSAPPGPPRSSHDSLPPPSSDSPEHAPPPASFNASHLSESSHHHNGHRHSRSKDDDSHSHSDDHDDDDDDDEDDQRNARNATSILTNATAIISNATATVRNTTREEFNVSVYWRHHRRGRGVDVLNATIRHAKSTSIVRPSVFASVSSEKKSGSDGGSGDTMVSSGGGDDDDEMVPFSLPLGTTQCGTFNTARFLLASSAVLAVTACVLLALHAFRQLTIVSTVQTNTSAFVVTLLSALFGLIAMILFVIVRRRSDDADLMWGFIVHTLAWPLLLFQIAQFCWSPLPILYASYTPIRDEPGGASGGGGGAGMFGSGGGGGGLSRSSTGANKAYHSMVSGL